MEIPSASEKISIKSADSLVPGGFWIRFLASFLDSIILGVVIVPIAFAVGFAIGIMAPGNTLLPNLAGWVIRMVGIYFYFGYFYSTRGASPGKMVLNLRVINSENGKNLTYMEAFLREFFGKIISAIPLLTGYIVAAFREDKKGFHDMIFKTQVLQQKK